MLTNRELYERLIGLRETLGERSLLDYLKALLATSRTRGDQDRLTLDEVAAMFTAAVTLEPPPVDTDVSLPFETTLAGFARWEAILVSQIADLKDFEQHPPGELAYFGVDAPRSSGDRATDARWYNFDPGAYLECGMAGSFGGWDEGDGLRKPVPGPVHPDVPPDPGLVMIATLSWDELAEFALCGQMYE